MCGTVNAQSVFACQHIFSVLDTMTMKQKIRRATKIRFCLRIISHVSQPQDTDIPINGKEEFVVETFTTISWDILIMAHKETCAATECMPHEWPT